MAKRGSRKKLKVEDIDKAISTLEKAADTLEKEQEEPPVLIPGFDPSPDDAEQEVGELWDALPGNEDYYLKIYKRKPLPIGMKGPEFKHEIMDAKSITDLEITVRDLARENDWGPGEYEVHALRKSGDLGGRPKKLAKPAVININYDQVKRAEPSGNQPAYEIVSNFVRTAKELFPQQQDPTKYLADIFKTSVETMKNFIPTNGNSQTGILDIIKTMKEMGTLGKDTSKPISIDDIVKLAPIIIAGVKDLGIFNRKEEKRESMLEVIAQLRASGLIKVAGEDKSDPMDTIGKVIEMMNTLSPLMKGGEGESSPVIELIRTVGPHVPKIVEDVTGTIRDVADVARIKLAAQMGLRPEQLTAPRTAERPEQAPVQISPGEPPVRTEIIPPPPQQAPKKEETTVVRNPLIQEILNAIEKKDAGYYPKLQQIIPTYLGAQVWDPLISGQATPEMFCQTMSTILNEPGINTDKAKEYVTSFVKWCRDEEEKNLIVARCKTCQAEVEFLSEDEWNQDSKKCDDCGGELERVTA
jgi:hypothetical protein